MFSATIALLPPIHSTSNTSIHVRPARLMLGAFTPSECYGQCYLYQHSFSSDQDVHRWIHRSDFNVIGTCP